jgi:hypothetical protein
MSIVGGLIVTMSENVQTVPGSLLQGGGVVVRWLKQHGPADSLRSFSGDLGCGRGRDLSHSVTLA